MDTPCTAADIAAILKAARERVGYLRWLAEKLRDPTAGRDPAIRHAAAEVLEWVAA